ncbi:MAG: bifunctional proline dehydrogenase/L-glutamate gamma-semialdehyde dehydrogenase PutA [Pseudomonadota bacterium]
MSALSDLFLADEATTVDALIQSLNWTPDRHAQAKGTATALVTHVRQEKTSLGALQNFLQQFSLDTDEGLALMTLAEALLRTPDSVTANALIADKVTSAQWRDMPQNVDDWVVRLAGTGLSLSRKTLDSLLGKLGAPVIRTALRQAVLFMGSQFILGKDSDDAIAAAKPFEAQGYRMSYDMLGEGARTWQDADKYLQSYEALIHALATAYPVGGSIQTRPTLSVKLSALHPRYEFAQSETCVPEMVARLLHLSRRAATANVTLTVDAEEAARLETSLEIMHQVHAAPELGDWEGFGMAIQAYDKRAGAVVREVIDWTHAHRRRLTPRLVKGAYWDSEIKTAHVNGLQDYPVFSRKVNTDVSYLACAQMMLAARDTVWCLFGTHNAYTAAALINMAGPDRSRMEFQRLHGMGEALHTHILQDYNIPASIYAPVGPYHDLLPYLVRRMLENGANSSFVNQLYNPAITIDSVTQDPVAMAQARPTRRHAQLPLPADIYGPSRQNAAGLALYAPTHLRGLQALIRNPGKQAPVGRAIINGRDVQGGQPRTVHNPSDVNHSIGTVYDAVPEMVDIAMETVCHGQVNWARTDVRQRAAILRRFADNLERSRDEWIVLLGQEAGKTIPDAVAEIREAVDFCRYYAAQAEAHFDTTGQIMPGPTGERNTLRLRPRGVFVCISPWNFPLAIFIGQVSAALAVGNTVLAKPAEQTPLIAYRAVKMLLEAGVPADAIALLPGGGDIGAAAVMHPDVAGVAFTGSTDVARKINRSLASKDGPIVPFIAETGGLNAMIVDSTALPEQVADSVIQSAFGSAGQRCSALRILALQDDIADRVMPLLHGMMATLRVGNPLDLSTDIGPVIDGDALKMLQDYTCHMAAHVPVLAQSPLSETVARSGYYFAPVMLEIPGIAAVTHEVFGPILHVMRYRATDRASVIAQLNATGYGLTFGVQTRISQVIQEVSDTVTAGNIYINRSIIGAVVGVQPFGGQGLSGTGPKAGGPHYLPRFATEQTITINTAATGGNLDLISLADEDVTENEAKTLIS